MLKATGIQAKAAQLLRLSPSQVHRLMHRAVERGLSRRDAAEAIEHVGLDEKSFSQGHHYATILTDTYRARVIDMVQTRTIEATQSLLQNSLSPSQREQILSISMDMWPPLPQRLRPICLLPRSFMIASILRATSAKPSIKHDVVKAHA